MKQTQVMKKLFENIFYFIVGSLVLSLLYYVVFSLFVCTDVEKQLRDENRLYRRELPEAERYASLVGEELEFLRMRDENIYRQVFKADAPDVSRMIGGDILTPEEAVGGSLVNRTWKKSSDAMSAASRTEADWRAIFEIVSRRDFVAPPLYSPVKNLHYTNVGASVGNKMNPFYKVVSHHDGIDIISPEGTPVLATAGGWVEKVQNADGGKGRMVEISHPGGYVTRYAHLSEISVKQGRYVRAGSQVGLVGDSGRSFSTHLHYEVIFNGRTLDPANFFMCSLTPMEYLNILIMSASSGQSMD